MSEAIRTWALGLVVLVLAVIACAIGFDGWKAQRRADKAEAVVVHVQADLATCRANTAKLSTSLDAQNAAVRKLQSDAKAAEKRAAELKAQADRENAKDDGVIAKLRKLSPVGDRCEAARDLLREELR